MPGIDATAPSAGGDELDDLFDYDIDVDAAFKDLEDKAKTATSRSRADGIGKSTTDLGIDEEVQIKNQRKPVPKLDEQRLLSERGIPKLRRITKEKFRSNGKGKGNEFKNMARFLSHYQLWLDDLYPRAKFLDSLAMVEKLGHSKSMHRRRKDWIDEGKSRGTWPAPDSQPTFAGIESKANHAPEVQEPFIALNEENTAVASAERLSDPNNLFLSDEDEGAGVPHEDELDALLAEETSAPKSKLVPSIPPLSQDSLRTSPVVEDDLDALWAAHEADAAKENQPPLNSRKNHSRAPQSRHDEEFEDEMEVMADLDLW